MHDETLFNCPFELTLELIDGKWKGLILWHLHDKKVLRNGQMLRLMPNITQKMLTQQLREMEKHNLVQRVIYEQIPPKVEYSLTPLGEALRPILEHMIEWGIVYARENAIPLSCEA